MSKKIDRATIIILDVGKNASSCEEKSKGEEDDKKHEKNFFESARECTSKIIERKILSQEKNYIGIILLGAKKSKNAMAEQNPGSFRHIEVFSELQPPSWQMIRNLPEKTTNSEGDWFDALIVAADHLKNGVEGVKFSEKKIILMTNFTSQCEFNSKTVRMILDGFKEDNLEVDIFGPDIYDSGHKSRDVDLARQLVHTTGGVSVSFDYCLKFLVYHQKKAVGCIPSNADLIFTPDIKIPVSCYVKIKDESVVKKWQKAIRDPVTNTASTTEGLVKNKIHINVEDQNVVETKELIKGYHYGQEIIPFSECDKNMLYKSGEKSLTLYGFTNADNISWHHLNGENLLYVFGRKGDRKAQQAIRCLVLCLHEQKLVGIVRRVAVRNCAPKLFALMPIIDSDNGLCLSMATICYKEDIKNMSFPPTNMKKYQCTEEQVDAFKDLIKAMDLMKAYDEMESDDTEAFPIAETVSPTIQHVLDCIAFRAMNPSKPLPEPRDDIMKLFKVPPLVEKRSQKQLEKLKQLLVLKKVEVKQRKQQLLISNDNQNDDLNSKADKDVDMAELPRIDINSITKTKDIQTIGTVDPISDYKALITNGKTLSDLSPLMIEAIESLVCTNIDGKYSKALECIKFFRKECVNSEPSYYNNWLKTFKMESLERKKHDLLELINSEKLDFILKSENLSSDIENVEQGDSHLYEADTMPTLTDVTINSQVKAFFDDM